AFGLFLAVEVELDDALDPASADHYRHPDIEVLDAVLPGQPGGAGQDPLLVAPIGLGHRDRRARPRMEGRAGPQEIDDLGETVASSVLVIVITKACGQCCLIAAPTSPTTLVLMPTRSSRLMPGLRGTPAVTMTTSAPLIAA